jgi:hypothetical protein
LKIKPKLLKQQREASMNKKKISLVLALISTLAISGCATTSVMNVVAFDNQYYRDSISKSKNYQDLKDYLSKNNIKLGTTGSVSYSTAAGAGLNNIVLDGQIRNFSSAEHINWIKGAMSELLISELSGLLLDVAGNTLSICGDYNHAVIGENASFGKVEYT